MNKTKGLIFESAVRIFSRSGYDGATMDVIASDAGVAKGTLYYYFKSKEEIFNFVIKEGIQVIKENVESVVGKKEDISSKIKALCKAQLELVYNRKEFIKVVMSQLWGQESRQLELREAINKYILYIESYLQEAMDKSFVKKGDSYLMAYTLFGTICSAALYGLIDEDEKKFDKLIDSLVRTILEGIQER